MRTEISAVVQLSTTGDPVASATITVTKRDGSPATVYADPTGGTILPQPLQAERGRIQGWVEDGSYKLVIGGNFVTATEYIEAVAGDGHVVLGERVTAAEAAIASTQTALANHAADATNVHGITDTAKLVSTDNGGIIPSSYLPPLAITTVHTAASLAEQLALTIEEGDLVIRTDTAENWIHNGGTTGTITDFTKLVTPSPPVLSVNNKTGVVDLKLNDLNSHLTEDANGPYTDKYIGGYNAVADSTWADAEHYFTLGVDDNGNFGFTVVNAAGANGAWLYLSQAGDAQDRLEAGYDGSLHWGNGTNPVDTTLLRDVAGSLTLNGSKLVTAANIATYAPAPDLSPYATTASLNTEITNRTNADATLVSLSPGSSTRNVIQPSSDFKALIVKGAVGQTQDPFSVQTNGGANLFKVDATGGTTTNGAATFFSSATINSGSANAVYLGLVGGAGSAGLSLGLAGDTNLYRGGAGQLKTDGGIYAPNGAGTFGAALTAAAGNVANQVRLGTIAGIEFGSAIDTNLYRSAADTLKTDDTLIVAGATSSATALTLGADGKMWRPYANAVQFSGDTVAVGEVFGGNNLAKLSSISSKGAVLLSTGTAYSAALSATANLGELVYQAQGTNPTKLITKGTASQSTTNLQEWQSSGGTAIAKVNQRGDFQMETGTANSGTTTNPRMIGFLNASQAPGKWALGDMGTDTDNRFSGLQSGQGNTLQMYSWWGIRLEGMRTANAPTFTSDSGVDPSVLVVSGSGSRPALGVRAAASQSIITNKALTTNIATLTTAAAHNFQPGQPVVVAGVDATFNGTYTIGSVPTSTTFTYNKTAGDIASTAATGTATGGTQTANLDEWQDPNGVMLSAVGPLGQFKFRKGFWHTDDTGQERLYFQQNSITTYRGGASNGTGNAHQWRSYADASIMTLSQAGDLLITGGFLQLTNNSSFLDVMSASANRIRIGDGFNSSIAFGSSSDATIGRTAAGQMTVLAQGANPTKFIVKGTTSQASTNLFEAQDSTSAVKALVDANGGVIARSITTSANVANSIGGANIGGVILATYAGGAGNIPIVTRGAASQTANLQEWQDSTPTRVAFIDPSGTLVANTVKVGGASSTGNYTLSSSAGGVLTFGANAGGFAHNMSTTTIALGSNGAGQLGTIIDYSNDEFTVRGQANNAVTKRTLIVKGIASQTGNLQEWQSSASALYAVTAAGLPRWVAAANVQTTVGAAGGASAPPATPTKWLKVVDDTGTTLVIPAYAAA